MGNLDGTGSELHVLPQVIVSFLQLCEHRALSEWRFVTIKIYLQLLPGAEEDVEMIQGNLN